MEIYIWANQIIFKELFTVQIHNIYELFMTQMHWIRLNHLYKHATVTLTWKIPTSGKLINPYIYQRAQHSEQSMDVQEACAVAGAEKNP